MSVIFDPVSVFWFTSVTKVIALALGAFIVYLAYRGYTRNRSKPLLYVAVGFALITLGNLVEGLLYVLFHVTDLVVATGIGTAITIIGFVAIIYSIYSGKD